MDRWVGKCAVVTGTSSGMGVAIAKSLVNAGLNVVGLARREDRLEALSKELEDNTNGSFHYLRCDLCNEEDILNAFEFVEEKFGGVDIFINNAGVTVGNLILDGNMERFRSLLDVNFFGPTICCREAVKSMRKQQNEGHIINLNSVLGLCSSNRLPNVNLYPASKAALLAMTDALRDEILVNKDNIRVTSMHPGLTKTEILGGSEKAEMMYKLFPYISSEDIADCVVFVLSAPPGVQISQIVITPLHGQA